MASKWMFSLAQWSEMGSISWVRSWKVKFLKPPVWVDRTAVGTTQVSTPIAEMMGRATVREHLPRQEISWMETTRFMGWVLLNYNIDSEPVEYFSETRPLRFSGYKIPQN